MADQSPDPPPCSAYAHEAAALPQVCLELCTGPHSPVVYEVAEAGFLLGTVPGCDLRLPGVDLAPVICLITPHPAGAAIRKLAPAQPVLVNGRPLSTTVTADGDELTVGPVVLRVRIQFPGQERSGELAAPGASPLRLTHLTVSQELADLRQQLYDNYRHRRDRLAGLEQALRRAARRVQERKRHVDEQARQAETRHEEDAARRSELDARAQELERQRQALDEQLRLLENRQQEAERIHAERLPAYEAREQGLQKERQALDESQAQHQADLVRLDRLQAALEQRSLEVDGRYEQLQRDSRDLEEQAQQLAEWHAQLGTEAERIAQQNAELEPRRLELARRTAAVETQQAMLVSLRGRLERLQEELYRQEQELAEQRARRGEVEADLQRQLQDLEQRRAQLDQEQQQRDERNRSVVEQSQAAETIRLQIEEREAAVAIREQELRRRQQALDTTAKEQAEQDGLLKMRLDEAIELQRRLATDRQALRDRETELLQGEQAREALQEQLRRRADELTEQHRTLAELERHKSDEIAALQLRQAELEQERAEHAGRIEQRERLRAEMVQREEALQSHLLRLRQAGRRVGHTRKALYEARRRWQAQEQQSGLAAARTQAEYDSARAEAAAVQQLFPELEVRARSALERLVQARQQLREHLSELHQYASQSQEDLQALRSQVQAEAEQVRQRELAVHRLRDEHRLGVAAFRQQLIEWQAQVAEMKRSLAQDETRLEQRQTEVEAGSARLARQAEELQKDRREVEAQRDEMSRHLADMRQWYRRKLRQLTERQRASTGAGERQRPSAGQTAERTGRETDHAGQEGEVSSDGSSAPGQAAADILSLTSDVDPGDRKLGELLRSMQLVEADTLHALLVEARKQRRSLRQMLLASGCVTLYQLALIEAGNVDGLMLGPVRVVDRLRATAQEMVYRVFDPRSGRDSGGRSRGYALLRHLADEEMPDAVRPDEFRQRFGAAAAVRHANVAQTLEVLEIAGRPAVLQEWVTGLVSADWPSLAAVPGVWFRLVHQAAVGLEAVHQAGLVHGHLQPDLLVLTSAGILKLCGLGEPPWLWTPPREARPGEDARADLDALGRIAAAWAATGSTRRKGATAKPLPEILQAILHRLTQINQTCYATVADLLHHLEDARDNVPANVEAWQRLLRHVREQAGENAWLRQSA